MKSPMGGLEKGGKVATAAVETLKSQPLALAVNLIFLCGGIFVLNDLAKAFRERDARKDQLMQELARDCMVKPKQDPDK